MYALRGVHYPVQHTGREVSKELRERDEYLPHIEEFLETLMDVSMIEGKYKMLVEWEGWLDPEGGTWQPLGHLKEDSPGMVKNFLHTSIRCNLDKKFLDHSY